MMIRPSQGGSARGDLVISMTLAETFLLLVFMIWFMTRPIAPPKPPLPLQTLLSENDELKKSIRELTRQLEDDEKRLRWWRTRFDQPVPGSEQELKAFLAEAGRGRPKCQSDNLLLQVSFVQGASTLRVLADNQKLAERLARDNIPFRRGVILSDPTKIDTLLAGVREYRKPESGAECRFDYRLLWSSDRDYREGREKFEKFLYSVSRQQMRSEKSNGQ